MHAVLVTFPSATLGLEPLIHPDIWLLQRFLGIQRVAIIIPAAPEKRYQVLLRWLSHSLPPVFIQYLLDSESVVYDVHSAGVEIAVEKVV